MPMLASLALALMTSVSPGTDTTLTVKPGTRLGVDNFAGSVSVTTWTRNAIRVRAAHHRQSMVHIESTPGRMELSSSTRMGVPTFVDYDLTLPTWMSIEVSGVGTDVRVDGLKADIKAETVKGDIRIMNSAGDMDLSTVQGVIELTAASGHVQASSVNDDVTASRCEGDLQLESVNGGVILVDTRGPNLDVSSVNGELIYSGAFQDGGSYSFSTHDGDVTLGVPEHSNLSVSVATYDGSFNSSFPVEMTTSDKRRKGREFRFTIGTGDANVELEAFQGDIRLVRPDAIQKLVKEHQVKAASERQDRDRDDEDNDSDSDKGDK